MGKAIYLSQQDRQQQKLMSDRIRNLNKKISKSTIEMEKLISELLPSEKPLPSPHRPNARSTHRDRQEINPEDSPYTPGKRKSNDYGGMKNSHVETNASTKFQESKDRFYSSFKEPIFQEPSSSRGKSLNSQINEGKAQPLIGQNTKFAIGQHLYPASSNYQALSRVSPRQPTLGNNKNIMDIGHDYVMQYALSRESLNERSRPEEIFEYFHEFAPYFRKPLIKKFKNCLYFGESPPPDPRGKSKYTGFLYFFTLKIYYGYFEEQYKHGLGVEINLKTGAIYKGSFNKGHKIGKFQVFSGEMAYEGYLHRGRYHGQGKLETPISIYEGEFADGMRNGEGEEYFFKSGLKLKGKFEMDKFCNKVQTQQKIFKPKQRERERSPPKEKMLPRINNIFEFSFHDSSEEQPEPARKRPEIKWVSSVKKPRIFEQKKISYECEMEEASDDDPLPAPFRRLAYNK